MAFFGKVYKLEKQENFEAFVDSIGLPDDKKATLFANKPDQKFEKDGNSYSHTVYINGVEKTVTFKSGKEFQSSMNDTPMKRIYTVDGNTITQVMKFGKNDEAVATIKKEFTGDKLVETITNSKWDGTAKLYFSA